MRESQPVWWLIPTIFRLPQVSLVANLDNFPPIPPLQDTAAAAALGRIPDAARVPAGERRGVHAILLQVWQQ